MRAKGVTQQQIADAAGISFKTVSSWKQRGSDPASTVIPAIAECLSVSCSYLLTGEEDVPPISKEAREIAELYERLNYENKAIIKGDAFKLLKSQTQCRQEQAGRQTAG